MIIMYRFRTSHLISSHYGYKCMISLFVFLIEKWLKMSMKWWVR